MSVRIVDFCGYLLPAAELLYERGLGPLRGHWPELEVRLALTAPTAGIGDWNSSYTRFVAAKDIAQARPGSQPTQATLPRPLRIRDSLEHRVLHDNRLGRLRELDRLGIDVQLLHPGPGIDVVMELEKAEAALLFNAYNSYVTTFCEADPQRLKAVLQFNAVETEWSAQELLSFADHPSVAGVTLHVPADSGLDRLDLSPFWDALARSGLPLIHRPTLFAWEPSQLMEHLLGKGVFRRWPNLRVVFAGWSGETLAGGAAAFWPEKSDREAAVQGISFAVETVSAEAADGIPAEALLWSSHFPFERAGVPEQIEQARQGDPRARAVLSDNPGCLFGRRKSVVLAAE